MSTTHHLTPDAATRRARLKFYRLKRRQGMTRGQAWLLMARLCLSVVATPYGRSLQSATLTRPRGAHSIETVADGGAGTVWTLSRELEAPSETVRHGAGYWVRRCIGCNARIMFATYADYMAGEHATACRSCQGTIGQPTDSTWPSDTHTVKVTGRKPTSRLVVRRGVSGVLGRADRTADDRTPWHGVVNADTRDALVTWSRDALAKLPVRADGTVRTLAISRATDQVSHMVDLVGRQGTEAMSWSRVIRVPNVIGLHAARHRCGLLGYWPSDAIGLTDADGTTYDMADSESGRYWSIDRFTLADLANCWTAPPVSPLAPRWNEVSRGIRWECERPDVRASERRECIDHEWTSALGAIVWATNPTDHERWEWPTDARPDVPMFYGREQDGGLTYRLRELVGPIGRDGGIWIGHRLLARGEHANTPEQVALQAERYTDADGVRHTAPVRESRLVTDEPVLVPLTGNVDQVSDALALVLSDLLATDGDMAELVGSTWHGRASRSASGRFAFTGATADDEPIRVGGQRSLDALAARLAMFVA